MDGDSAGYFDDAEILQRVTENMDDDFHLLVAKYKKTIFAVAWSMLGNQQDAEEVTADTFVQACQSLPKLIEKGQGIYLRPWLITIVTNGCLNHKRHEGRQRRPPPGVSLDTDEGRDRVDGTGHYQAPSAEDEAIRHENTNELYRLLRQLPQRQLIIVILYYIGGLSDSEIASILERKRDTIKKDRERALQRLKKLREKDG